MGTKDIGVKAEKGNGEKITEWKGHEPREREGWSSEGEEKGDGEKERRKRSGR